MKPLTDGERLFWVIRCDRHHKNGSPAQAIDRACDDVLALRAAADRLVSRYEEGGVDMHTKGFVSPSPAKVMLRDMLGAGEVDTATAAAEMFTPLGDCRECGGRGHFYCSPVAVGDLPVQCSTCHGTGKAGEGE